MQASTMCTYIHTLASPSSLVQALFRIGALSVKFVLPVAVAAAVAVAATVDGTVPEAAGFKVPLYVCMYVCMFVRLCVHTHINV